MEKIKVKKLFGEKWLTQEIKADGLDIYKAAGWVLDTPETPVVLPEEADVKKPETPVVLPTKSK